MLYCRAFPEAVDGASAGKGTMTCILLLSASRRPATGGPDGFRSSLSGTLSLSQRPPCPTQTLTAQVNADSLQSAPDQRKRYLIYSEQALALTLGMRPPCTKTNFSGGIRMVQGSCCSHSASALGSLFTHCVFLGRSSTATPLCQACKRVGASEQKQSAGAQEAC